ncbi:MAG: hypothetical protein INR71_13865, partial [Terriglobus roseus]|nr:hypothetical protein [Terriglobus roseus]
MILACEIARSSAAYGLPSIMSPPSVGMTDVERQTLQQAVALAGSALPNIGGNVSGPLTIGTSGSPMLLSQQASQNGLFINMVSPGTPTPIGPATAHHGADFHCTKSGFFGTNPGSGEMDCLNLVVRQDGLGSATFDAGDAGGILADVSSTLRAQNFTGVLEAHTSIVDTTSNTTPYYLDIQQGSISTTGYPTDDGTKGQGLQAFYAALLDGHGSGFSLVEGQDTSSTASHLGHGIIDNVLSAMHYTGEIFFNVDGSGNVRMPDGSIVLGGRITGPDYGLDTTGSEAMARSGWSIGWNASAGGNETDFYNAAPTEYTGGFRWFDRAFGTAQPIL